MAIQTTSSTSIRKTITDLSEPQQIRELNRQLDWVWRQLLGKLDVKSFSTDGLKQLIETTQDALAEEISGGDVGAAAFLEALWQFVHGKITSETFSQIAVMRMLSSVFTIGMNNGAATISNLRVTEDNIRAATAGLRQSISDIQNQLEEKPGYVSYDDWEIGGVSNTDGSLASNDYTIRSAKKKIDIGDLLVFNGIGTNRVLWSYYYDSSDAYIGRNRYFTVPENAASVIFTYGFATSSGITVESYGFDNLVSDISIRILKSDETEEVLTSKFGPILDTADTYFERAYNPNTQFHYAGYRGLYHDNINDDGGVNAIQCSQFTTALLSGTRYENSRYVNDKNERAPWGFTNDGSYGYVTAEDQAAGWIGNKGYRDRESSAISDNSDYPEFLRSYELKFYCDKHGWSGELDKVYNNLAPGDVLFWADDTLITDRYQGIHHDAVLLQKTEHGIYALDSPDSAHTRLIDNAPAGVRVTYFDNDSSVYPTHYAKIPILNSYNHKAKLVYENDGIYAASYSSSDTYTMRNFEFSRLFERGFYTFEWECETDGSSTAGITLVTGESTTQNRKINPFRWGNKYYGVIYAECPFSNAYFNATDATEYVLKSVKIYKGYHMQML